MADGGWRMEDGGRAVRDEGGGECNRTGCDGRQRQGAAVVAVGARCWSWRWCWNWSWCWCWCRWVGASVRTAGQGAWRVQAQGGSAAAIGRAAAGCTGGARRGKRGRLLRVVNRAGEGLAVDQIRMWRSRRWRCSAGWLAAPIHPPCVPRRRPPPAARRRDHGRCPRPCPDRAATAQMAAGGGLLLLLLPPGRRLGSLEGRPLSARRLGAAAAPNCGIRGVCWCWCAVRCALVGALGRAEMN